jgi:hypothetical protein
LPEPRLKQDARGHRFLWTIATISGIIRIWPKKFRRSSSPLLFWQQVQDTKVFVPRQILRVDTIILPIPRNPHPPLLSPRVHHQLVDPLHGHRGHHVPSTTRCLSWTWTMLTATPTVQSLQQELRNNMRIKSGDCEVRSRNKQTTNQPPSTAVSSSIRRQG